MASVGRVVSPGSTDAGETRVLLLVQDRVEGLKFSNLFHKPSKNSQIGRAYFEKISRPVSLRTIRVEVKKRLIQTIDQYVAKLNLMLKNKLEFYANSPKISEITEAVDTMREETLELFDEYQHTQKLMRERKSKE